MLLRSLHKNKLLEDVGGGGILVSMAGMVFRDEQSKEQEDCDGSNNEVDAS